MSDQSNSTNPVAIVYQGTLIHQKSEMLSLTDMWKAAKSPSERRPSDWRILPQVIDFVGFITLTTGKSGSLIVTKEGRGGGTWAHWQIAMAYAKYLSPQFHAWCNTVVRERMEGIRAVQPVELDRHARETIGGIVKAVVGKQMQDALRELLPAMLASAISADPRVAIGEYVSVCELLDHAKVPSKKRNGLNRRIGAALRNQMLQDTDTYARRCPRTGTWLFPADVAHRFMAAEGRTLVRAHIDEMKGQTVLHLVRPAQTEGEPVVQ